MYAHTRTHTYIPIHTELNLVDVLYQMLRDKDPQVRLHVHEDTVIRAHMQSCCIPYILKFDYSLNISLACWKWGWLSIWPAKDNANKTLHVYACTCRWAKLPDFFVLVHFPLMWYPR